MFADAAIGIRVTTARNAMSESGKPNGSSHLNGGTSETLAQIARLISGTDDTETSLEGTDKSSRNSQNPTSITPDLVDLTSETLLDALPTGLAVFQGTKLLKANTSFALALGYRNADELIQAGGSDALFEDNLSGLKKAFAAAGKAADHKVDLKVRTRSGRIIKIPIAVHPVRSDADAPARLAVLHPQTGEDAKDVAEKIKLGTTSKTKASPELETESEVVASMSAAPVTAGKRAKKKKKKKSDSSGNRTDRPAPGGQSDANEFLAKVSHELRTPLNSIIGFAELMKEEQLGPVGNERYRGYIRDIHDSGLYALSLVNDLLDISKIKSGEFELNFTAVCLEEVITESVQSMQPQAQRRRVLLRTSFADNLPEILADRRSVRQIILNLVSNAIKFTLPGGQVIVSVQQTEPGGVRMRVRDTGIGMSKNEVTVAMKPYKQVDTAPKSQIGTGLGLPLTKALVEANRARFKVRSATGTGTRVDVNFPRERVAERRS